MDIGGLTIIKKMSNLYNENSIESLSPLEITQLKPQLYAGDCTYATQLLIEVFSNAVDEFNIGHGKVIDIKIKNNVISIQDEAQGFIVNSLRQDGETVLQAAFDIMNTSGKYRQDGTYEGSSLGSFGVGNKLTNFLSKYLIVRTVRDNKFEKLLFELGKFKNREIGECNEHSGTYIEFEPDPKYFIYPTVEDNKIDSIFSTISCLCPGLIINFDNNGNIKTYFSKKGIEELIDKEKNSEEIIKRRLVINETVDKQKINLALTFTGDYSSKFVSYVNTGLVDAGTHLTQLKTIITRELNNFYKENGWLDEGNINLSGVEIQEGLLCVFNMTVPDVRYDSQVKTKVTKIDLSILMPIFTEKLRIWLNTNKSEIKKLADKAIGAKKAAEAAKKARDAIRAVAPKAKEKGLKGKIALSDKFVDCVNKTPKQRNLLLVEGTSAASAAVESRNVKTDAIYMLRGKTKSPLKHTIDILLENQEISDITKVIGAGIAEDFDVKKMQFDKIVITSDQDPDGFSIELLLTTFFYTYMRPLVEQGHLYRAVTPLYIIESSRGKEYCYTEEELIKYREENRNNKYDIKHCKGLGSVSPEILKEICFEHQRYKQITVGDIEKTTELLNILEGPDAALRRQFIYENATRLGFNFI